MHERGGTSLISSDYFSNFEDNDNVGENKNDDEGDQQTNSTQEDPLKKHAEQAKHTLEEWVAKYKDMSWKEIATEAGWKDGQPLGPNKEWRYIKAPDGNVMDMRHVLIVGYGYGESAGRGIEHLQNLRSSTRGSAFDPQDYYSNKIGAYYYQMRHSGSWASNSIAYDFKRFIDVHYRTLFNNYKP